MWLMLLVTIVGENLFSLMDTYGEWEVLMNIGLDCLIL